MDKKTILGIVLIILVTLMMPVYQKWIVGEKPVQQQTITQPKDTTFVVKDTARKKIEAPAEEPAATPTLIDTGVVSKGTPVMIQESPEKKTIDIETDLVHVVWSTEHGGNPVLWELKKYDYYKGGNVNLIDNNYLKLNFLNVDGKQVNLDDYNFYADFENNKKVVLNDYKSEYEFKFYLPVKNGRIVKTIHFYRDRYSFDVRVSFENLSEYIINRRYFIAWQNGLPLTEENVKDDNSYSRAYAYMAKELESLDASEDKTKQETFNGNVDWIAVRTKYFLASIVPFQSSATNGANLSGIQKTVDNMPHKDYTAAIEMNYPAKSLVSDTFSVYIGPLDYYILKKYDVGLQTLVMNKDWYERLFRPISTLFIIPSFKFLHRFIPNYGLVIIIFSILIKLILHPLTKKSYQSMSEMQFLQPKMTELREKYKNEPQRLNKEMMKLYKEHGVNPLGGCLPMLLQMPVLFALFIVFRSTIQLRGKPFVLWINDLARPDVLHLGFHLPLVGNSLHVLPILMALTMIWQSKMSMTDPKQKAMVYFMPIFMVFIFYSLPSGLNLYYAVFNLLSMAQTYQIKKKMHPGNETAEAKPVPVKATRSQTGKKRKK
ncbi:MAG: membrane protein insertase YidC [Calditrichia bacterium]